MDFNQDSPLGQQFNANPYEYLQNYIRSMNNQIFLSEYQINNLYALLLIGRVSPWDNLRTTSVCYKQQVDTLIQKRIKDVKYLLDNLSQLYEDKVKKTTFNQIQRLMSIIKAKNKSIYIEKSPVQSHTCEHKKKQQQNPFKAQQNCMSEQHMQKRQDQKIEETNQNQQKKQNETKQQNKNSDGLQVFGLISGLGNIPNLSTLALGNCLQYNTTQRYIKFKMTRNYIMTIKNDDPVQFDLTSRISKVPSHTFVNHIFPYLTAWELFRARSVCKEWLGLVKDGWHSTFKRQMYVQLLAGEFCKDIQFFYKCIQLRNPFFHKLSLLLHALIEIIEWQSISLAIEQNRINAPLKRVLLVLLKLIGENIQISNYNDFNQSLWNQHKHLIVNLKQKVIAFFSNFAGNSMSINQLRVLKVNILDHPFMRGDQMQTEQKTPLLLLIFVKQLNLQQILKNHLHFSQQYLLNSKNRLDQISVKMPHQRGFLQGVYKILLMKTVNQKQQQQLEQDGKQMPNFQQMIQAIFENKQSDKPDFYIKTKSSKTCIYMDRSTKLDIIISIVKKTYGDKLEGQNQTQNKEQKAHQMIQQGIDKIPISVNQSQQKLENDNEIAIVKQQNTQTNLNAKPNVLPNVLPGLGGMTMSNNYTSLGINTNNPNLTNNLTNTTENKIIYTTRLGSTVNRNLEESPSVTRYGNGAEIYRNELKKYQERDKKQ